MARFKYVIAKELTISRSLMSIGALWIIIYGVLVANGIINTIVAGWYTSGTMLILIGLFYILLPFSTKPGWWSRSWAILLAVVSVFTVFSFFVGKHVDLQSIWTYIEALPHLLMTAGAILWIIQS